MYAPSSRSRSLRRSTKTSRYVRAILVLAVVLVSTALPIVAAAGVNARGSVELDRPAGSSAHKQALAQALAAAVETIASRHLVPEEREKRSRELTSLYSKSASYILRYAVRSEGVVGESYRVDVSAEVDAARVLAALRAKGFTVNELKVLPRLEVAPGPALHSVELCPEVAKRFGADELSATCAETVVDTVETGAEVVRNAAASGAHIVAFIDVSPVEAVDETGAGRDAGGKRTGSFNFSDLVGNLKPGESAEPVATTVERYAVKAVGELVDTSTMESLGRVEFVVEGQGTTLEDAGADARYLASEDLVNALLIGLYNSGWALGDADLTLTLTVGGLDSPGPVKLISEGLASLAEFSEVRLTTLGVREATWKVRAVGATADWVAVLGALHFDGGAILWQSPTAAGVVADAENGVDSGGGAEAREGRMLALSGVWSGDR